MLAKNGFGEIYYFAYYIKSKKSKSTMYMNEIRYNI